MNTIYNIAVEYGLYFLWWLTGVLTCVALSALRAPKNNVIQSAPPAFHEKEYRPPQKKSSSTEALTGPPLSKYDLSTHKGQLAAVQASDFKIKRLINYEASKVFKLLEPAVGSSIFGAKVFPEASLGSFLGTPDSDEGRAAWKAVNSKRVDFLVTDRTSSPILALEYQGSGHHMNNDARERDAIKRMALLEAGIPVLEVLERFQETRFTAALKEILDLTHKIKNLGNSTIANGQGLLVSGYTHFRLEKTTFVKTTCVCETCAAKSVAIGFVAMDHHQAFDDVFDPEGIWETEEIPLVITKIVQASQKFEKLATSMSSHFGWLDDNRSPSGKVLTNICPSCGNSIKFAFSDCVEALRGRETARDAIILDVGLHAEVVADANVYLTDPQFERPCYVLNV